MAGKKISAGKAGQVTAQMVGNEPFDTTHDANA